MFDNNTATTMVDALEYAQELLLANPTVSKVGELESVQRALNLAKAVQSGDTIASLWSVEDVYSLSEDENYDGSGSTGDDEPSDITLEQARATLALAERNHDATIGINWDSLQAALDAVQEDEA